MVEEASYDLVVIGGGFAGMIAAVRGAELGLRACVLEQGDGERYPCNSRFSGGIFHVAYNDVKKPAAELRAAIERATAGEARAALAHAVSVDASRVVDWLAERGARFMRVSAVEWQRWLLAPPRPLTPGLDWAGRGPDVMLRLLDERLGRHGGRVFRGVRATALRPERSGAITVIARTGAGNAAWRGRAVVCADGGFQADPGFFRAHIGPRPERVKQRGAATGRGDALRMAVEIGAALTPLGRFYGHLLAAEALTNDNLWPYPELDAVGVAGIVVDQAGRRFLDEGIGGVAMANALARLDDPAGATLVFDGAIWEGPGRSARIPANPNIERAGATIVRSDTVGGLAERLGIPAATLASTVATYNDAHREGTLHALTPARGTAAHAPLPIERPPFMAIRICPGITHTMGGIAVDGDGRALRTDGSVIAGLYAAGASSGGLEGGGTTGGYVGGLSKAGVLGLRSAEHAAASLR